MAVHSFETVWCPFDGDPDREIFGRGGFSLAREGVQGVSLRRRTWRLGLPGACLVGRDHFRRSLGAALHGYRTLSLHQSGG